MMLKAFGALVLIVLIVGPILLQIGVLGDAGVFRELIELEVKAFGQLVELIRGLINGRA